MQRTFESVTRRVKPLSLPVVRGAVSLFETMFIGITALNFSADEAAKDDPSEVAKTAASGGAEGAKPSEGGIPPLVQALTVAFSLTLGMLLFVVMRSLTRARAEAEVAVRVRDAFLSVASHELKMARVLGFHGAEHKAIHALEAGVELTPENVQKFSRLHPRCGTTFLFIVVVISIVLFTFIGKPANIGQHLLRIACMPLIAGIAFEFIRLGGKYFGNPIVRAVMWPGMQFQLLTTREPDLDMCATAIASLNLVKDDPTVLAMQKAGGMKEVSFIQ